MPEPITIVERHITQTMTKSLLIVQLLRHVGIQGHEILLVQLFPSPIIIP